MLCFKVDAVLTEENPRYHPSYPSGQYCYAKIELSFTGVIRADWIGSAMHPNVDPDGEVDYGNIDVLKYDQGHYELEGDWDRMHVYRNADPTVTYL